MASMTIGAIFLFFLLVMFASGLLSGRSVGVPVGKKIGVLEVYGTIIDAKKLIEQIGDFRDSDAVKAVVLRVD